MFIPSDKPRANTGLNLTLFGGRTAASQYRQARLRAAEAVTLQKASCADASRASE